MRFGVGIGLSSRPGVVVESVEPVYGRGSAEQPVVFEDAADSASPAAGLRRTATLNLLEYEL